MRLRLALLLIVLVGGMPACSGGGADSPPPTGMEGPAEALVYALVKEVRKHVEPGGTLYLQLDNGDPSGRLVSALQQGGLILQPISKWPLPEKAGEFGGAVILMLDDLRQNAPGSWSGNALFDAGRFNTGDFEAQVEWNGRSWSVTSMELSGAG